MSEKKYPENQTDTKPEDNRPENPESARESRIQFDPSSISAATMCVYAGPEFWNGGQSAAAPGMFFIAKQVGEYCPQCGFKLTENANYCSECGAKVKKDT